MKPFHALSFQLVLEITISPSVCVPVCLSVRWMDGNPGDFCTYKPYHFLTFIVPQCFIFVALVDLFFSPLN